jgi:hypothetical protein
MSTTSIPPPVQVEIKIPASDKHPYVKADFFQVANVGTDYAISCFQLDYQALALAQEERKSRPDDQRMLTVEAVGVARLVLDVEAFKRLRDELNGIYDKVTPK